MPGRTPPRRPKEVFVSHSHRDVQHAARLVTELQRHGIKSFFSPHSIRGAQQWHDEIGAALRRCDWFAVILSPASVRSMWVKRELVYALSQPRYENRIAPLLFKTCDFEQLSWALVPSQFIDFRSEFESGCRRLLQTWGCRWK